MSKASEYTVIRIDDNMFELWHDDKLLATLTKEEAWPVMKGQIHPTEAIQRSASYDRNSDR